MRYFLLLLMTGMAFFSTVPHATGRSAERCFSETGFCISGRIRSFWEQNGGLPVFGFPTGPEQDMAIEGRMVRAQQFERNRLELHPGNRPPYDVLLGRLGAERLSQMGRDWRSFPQSQPQPGCRFFPETGHNVCGDILAAWRANGLELDGRRGTTEAESLALFGLPLSDLVSETLSDGKTYQVQWFERARFELHPELAPPHRVLLGLLGNETQHSGQASQQPSLPSNDWLEQVNAYRARAGVPPVTADPTLNDNCVQHARYMAENGVLTHDQNPSLPWASGAGQTCAQKGNVWLGSGNVWKPLDAIDGWMMSVGHRAWLLYPTTPTFGFGFYQTRGVSAAGLDVLTHARLDQDTTFPGWPVRYPGGDQQDVPPIQLPITLFWPYFGPTPDISSVSLRTGSGTSLPHSATTDLPGGHKGVAIIPAQALPPFTTIEVRVTGTYDGRPFNVAWQFTTRR